VTLGAGRDVATQELGVLFFLGISLFAFNDCNISLVLLTYRSCNLLLQVGGALIKSIKSFKTALAAISKRYPQDSIPPYRLQIRVNECELGKLSERDRTHVKNQREHRGFSWIGF
jgi:hypothetical protein